MILNKHTSLKTSVFTLAPCGKSSSRRALQAVEGRVSTCRLRGERGEGSI